MMIARYNAVIVGQSGVGKSTLINYLYGQKVAEAGVGKPVTKNGFHPIDFEINGMPVCLFDSWGLEVGKYKQWMQELDKEFQQRGVNESADKWFHSVFYCIQAGGARIQECDITIIKKFIAENYKVSVVLTKCDQVELDVEEKLKAELQRQINGLSVISICGEEKKTRTGTTELFGKSDVERQAFNDFFGSLSLRLPLRCKRIMEQALEKWVKESKENVRNNIGFYGRNEDDMTKKITGSIEKLRENTQELVNEEIKKTAMMYGSFTSHLGYISFATGKDLGQSIQIDDDDNWFITVLIYAISPIFMFKIKEWAIKDVESLIHSHEKEFKELINEKAEEVAKMLESLKLKVIGQT